MTFGLVVRDLQGFLVLQSGFRFAQVRSVQVRFAQFGTWFGIRFRARDGAAKAGYPTSPSSKPAAEAASSAQHRRDRSRHPSPAVPRACR